MTAFVNPPEKDVEGFLRCEGTVINRDELGSIPVGYLPVISKFVKRNIVFYCLGLMLIWSPATSLSEESGTATYGRTGNSNRRLDYDEALVGRLQRTLRRLGYYGGRISGFLDQDTQEAIARFQVDAGDAVSAVPDRSLLVSLGLIRRHKAWARQKRSHRTRSAVVKG
jgi:hypothetical protein